MKNKIQFIILTTFLFFSCKKASDNIVVSQLISQENSGDIVKKMNYKATNVSVFFENLVQNHWQDFAKIDSIAFNNVCRENECDPKDSLNLKKFYTLGIIHKLFTSKSAKNGSRGDILNIPYFWHWVTPNPRYEIAFTKDKKLLKNSLPPKEFAKYNSFADIDRTPYLFLSELLLEKPKYYTEAEGEFSTFGWCSEREMAFVCLLETLGFNGKVMTNANHSWSEFIISLSSKTNSSATIRVKVDNTFDHLTFEKITGEELSLWKKNVGNATLAKWYNVKAHSLSEKKKLKALVVSDGTMKTIEKSVAQYLNQIKY
jgi:hypothetical protein